MASLRFMSSKRDSIKVMKMKSNGARETPRFLFQAFLLKRRRRRGGKNQRNQNDSESKKEGMKLNIGVEIRGSSWIASDHRSQRSCSELSNPGFLTHTCNIHRDIFAFRHRRRDAIRCLPRYYVAGIARFLVHFFFSSFFFFILLEIDPAGSSFSGEIFLSPGVNRGILFWIENKRRERRRSVKYFKVSMWDFLNCSPSGIGMNTEVEEFWWILCAQCSMIWR